MYMRRTYKNIIKIVFEKQEVILVRKDEAVKFMPLVKYLNEYPHDTILDYFNTNDRIIYTKP